MGGSLRRLLERVRRDNYRLWVFLALFRAV